MQTSGTNPPLSDGVKKTIVGAAPPARRDPRPPGDKKDAQKPAAPTAHRAGGHAKHARRSQ